MSWASAFIKHNRGFIGNAVKNISPFLALTPLGIPASLAAGALGRAIQPGAKLGDILSSGASNAALGAGVQGGMGALRSAFSPSSSPAINQVAGQVAGRGVPGVQMAGESAVMQGPGAAALRMAPNMASAASGAGQSLADRSLASRVGSVLGRVGSFAENHPKTLEMGLGALDTTKGDYMRAQTNALNANTQMTREEYDAQKRRQAAMAPVWAAFMGQLQNMQTTPYPIANNPYGTGR